MRDVKGKIEDLKRGAAGIAEASRQIARIEKMRYESIRETAVQLAIQWARVVADLRGPESPALSTESMLERAAAIERYLKDGATWAGSAEPRSQ